MRVNPLILITVWISCIPITKKDELQYGFSCKPITNAHTELNLKQIRRGPQAKTSIEKE